MFCPECGAEFRQGFAECNACGVALVEEGPPPGPVPGARELVVVGRYLHPAEAAVVHCALRGAGIRCWLLNEHMVSIYWLAAAALGGICLVVDAEDSEEVAAWLKDAIVDSPPLPSDEYQALRSSFKQRGAILLTWLYLIQSLPFVLIIAAIIYRKRRRRQTELEDLEDVFD